MNTSNRVCNAKLGNVVLITGYSIREFSGRAFSHEDIEQIKWIRNTYKHLSEKELASTICESIGWLTPSGMPKRVQCVQFLRQLAGEGVIDLQKSQRRSADLKGTAMKAVERAARLTAPPDDITEASGLELEIAKAGLRLQLLRAYLEKYHTLSDNTVFGDRLYYFVTVIRNRELGCLRFSASSWALKDREQWIGWDNEQLKERLFLIA